MRTRLLPLLIGIIAPLLVSFCTAPAPAAAGWSTSTLPRHTTFSTVSCTSSHWCLARGGWQDKAQVGHWNGTRWSVSSDVPNPRGSAVASVACRSSSSCIAVGELYPRVSQPINPLVERWDGRRWTTGTAPKPPAPAGYRGVNGRLSSVACPSAHLCFAVGQAVPFGAGNAPGGPLIERWDGRRWTLVHGPAAASPLTSISCTSPTACTAVGGFEHETGTADANNQQVEYPNVVERWNGRSWSLGSVAIPSDSIGGALIGISCTGSSSCLGVGDVFEGGPDYAPGSDGGNHQAIAASGDGTTFSASTLAFPATAYRAPGSGTPTTWLTAISCATTTWCAAVGSYNATNGAIGPLAATWNGSGWKQIALRRGPVQLFSVSCSSRTWCMAVGGTIAERWAG